MRILFKDRQKNLRGRIWAISSGRKVKENNNYCCDYLYCLLGC